MQIQFQPTPLCLMPAFLAIGFLSIGCKPEELTQQEDAQAAAEELAKASQPPMEDQVAKVGVGLKGNSLDDIGENDARGILAYPAVAYFKTKEKIVFEIQIPQALNLFEATNGRKPKSQEEYMRDIIDANKIKLPILPDGMVYEYKPDVHELWVVAAKK